MGRRVLRGSEHDPAEPRPPTEPRPLSETLGPLLGTPAPAIMGATAAGMLVVYAAARFDRLSIAPLLLRILAVIGFVTPGAFVLHWYRGLAAAREWTRQFEIDAEPVMERFLLNAVVLLSFGFVLLVTGIFLARRIDDREVGDTE